MYSKYQYNKLVFLDILAEDHRDASSLAHTLQREAQKYFEEKKKFRTKEYLQLITPSKTFFKTRIAKHFRTEEKVLFPILQKESHESSQIIKTMISEHTQIMEKFVKFEIMVDYKKSLKSLINLMEELSEHVKNEDEFFSSIYISKEETAILDDIAGRAGISLT